MSELISGREGSADTVVDVATVLFRFRAVVVTEKLVFDKTYEMVGVGGSHLGTHGYAELPCYTLPPTQHHNFFRNLLPIFTESIFLLRVAFGLGLGLGFFFGEGGLAWF